jgi:hypothetical protein
METTGKEFVEFWGWASSKGLMNKNTAQSLATSAKQVIGVDENWETVDVSSLDIDELLRKFRNVRKKDVIPDSLQVYERRFKQALDLFLQYARDPANWKYKSQTSAARKAKTVKQHTLRSPEAEGELFASQSMTSVPMMDYPYPLRENCIVRMKLPVDLKMVDIDRLIAFLRTLVIDTNQSL